MRDKTKKIRDSYINIRCYAEDKMYAEERAKNGYGKGKQTLTNFMLYDLRQVDDASPINLDLADDLIRSISDNRQPLAATHQNLIVSPQELNAIGKNINQVAKAVNTIMLKANKNGEATDKTIIKLLSYQNGLTSDIREIFSIMDRYNESISTAKSTINSLLRKEDEVLTRCLAFPNVGTNYNRYSQLMRMLIDYQNEAGIRNEWSINVLKNNLQMAIDKEYNNISNK